MDKKVLENVKFRVSAPVVMLVVALVIAGIVSFWSYGLLQKKTVVDVTPADTQQVVVAAYDLKWGTVITNEVVKTQPYLKGSLPHRALRVAVVARPPVFGGRAAKLDPEKAKALKGVIAVVPVQVDRGGIGVAVVAAGYWPARQARNLLDIEWALPLGVDSAGN